MAYRVSHVSSSARTIPNSWPRNSYINCIQSSCVINSDKLQLCASPCKASAANMHWSLYLTLHQPIRSSLSHTPSSANQEFPSPYSLHQPIRSSFPLTPFISQSGVPFPVLHYLITTSIYLLVNMGHYATCVVVRGHRSGIDLLSSTWAPGMEGGGQECSLNLLTACPILIHDVFSILSSLTELFSRFQPQQ